MRIENYLPVQRVTLSPAAGDRNGAAGADFLDAIRAAERVVPLRGEGMEQPAASAIREASPAQLYQTAVNRAAVETALEEQLPAHWTDRYLADAIGGRDTPISTAKSVNWASKGDKQLTREQIAGLKEKYDVSRLSGQEYYDLLADLTQLGALSGEDCIGAQLHTFQGPQAMFIPYDDKLLQLRRRRSQAGDMPVSLTADLGILMDHLAWTRTEQCRQMNASTTPEEWAQYRAGIQKDIRCRQKVLALLEQLK